MTSEEMKDLRDKLHASRHSDSELANWARWHGTALLDAVEYFTMPLGTEGSRTVAVPGAVLNPVPRKPAPPSEVELY